VIYRRQQQQQSWDDDDDDDDDPPQRTQRSKAVAKPTPSKYVPAKVETKKEPPTKAEAKAEPSASASLSAQSLVGRWSWQASCSKGQQKFGGEFEIKQATPATFSGEFLSRPAGRLTGGNLQGDKVSFQHEPTPGQDPQRWTGQLVGVNQMQGSVTNVGQADCTFTAAKK
jgi:hypothetical protein